MEPIRVLQIFGEPFSNGGQESYIMNMYRHIDRQRVQFDFFTPFVIRNPGMQAEVEALGGQMSAAGHPFNVDNNRYFREAVSAFLSSHRYHIVHIHSGSTYALMIGSKLARQNGVKHVAVHSHCGGFVNLKYKVIRLLSRQPLLTYPTHYFACSHLAARWKFPTPIIRKQRYTVLKNAVDTRSVRLDEQLRSECRRELGLEDKLVIGHVGRFVEQKNHRFLLEVFAELVKLEPEACLVLAGEGVLLEQTLARAEELGISDRMQYLGVRRDIPALMNAFDVFVLPSFFEGLPVVGIEAQATGLPVITSTGVTPELPIEDLATYLPLELSPREWAQKVLEAARKPRRNTTEEIIATGYDVQVAARIMQQKYEEMT
ncbi:MAG: glycosyltransferase [Clostridia bacterium]|nr:glycosyltransferase [Clostridia bacterium]